jgi:hypothetical protein
MNGLIIINSVATGTKNDTYLQYIRICLIFYKTFAMKKIIRFTIVFSAIVTMFMSVSCYPGYRARHHDDNEQHRGDRDRDGDHH